MLGRRAVLRACLVGLAAGCGGAEFAAADPDGGTAASGSSTSASSSVSASSATVSATASGAGGADPTGVGGASATSGSGTTSSGPGGPGTGSSGAGGSGPSTGAGGGTTVDASLTDAGGNPDVTADRLVVADTSADRTVDAPRDATTCASPTECPTPPSRCRVAACTAGMCGVSLLMALPSSAQTPGDCRRIDCVQGDESIVIDNTDTDDRNECTQDACNNGVPSHTVLSGGRCANNTKFCNANGACVGCNTEADCTDAITACTKRACVQGQCMVVPRPGGDFCNGFADQCDGAGHCVDCFNSGGCDECCVCNAQHVCIQAFQGE